MFVQNLDGPTQPIVNHELDAGQHTCEEHIHEIKDNGGSQLSFSLSFTYIIFYVAKCLHVKN